MYPSCKSNLSLSLSPRCQSATSPNWRHENKLFTPFLLSCMSIYFCGFTPCLVYNDHALTTLSAIHYPFTGAIYRSYSPNTQETSLVLWIWVPNLLKQQSINWESYVWFTNTKWALEWSEVTCQGIMVIFLPKVKMFLWSRACLIIKSCQKPKHTSKH